MSASCAGEAPVRTAETTARSAPSESRTSTKRRNQRARRSGGAGAEVETCVVPVAGENPVSDGSAVERKAHVRTAVVDGEDAIVGGDQAHRVAVNVDHEALDRSQLRERRGANICRVSS